MARSRIGIWLIGAKGGVATTAITGLLALKRGLIGKAGLVSELPQFQKLQFAAWDDFVVGGHDIREGDLFAEASRMHTESRAIDAEILSACRDDFAAIEANIRLGTLLNVGPTISGLAAAELREGKESPRDALKRIQQDLKSFIDQHELGHVIMVNVASTEPPLAVETLPASWKAFEALLDEKNCPLPASTIYAVAALDLGCSYINFTPSLGSTPVALDELARARGTRHMGYDGKTGETLLKSVLAPMFAKRNLEVMSWVGHNIFGNMDGKVLDDPVNKKSKVTSKDRLLREILGYSPQTLVSIEYIQSMGDWKTAWDHIHFRGFLGTPMVFQFTWQGCDSILAAPLVLDLVRFTERAHRSGEIGTLSFLSSFFKSPLAMPDHDFGNQFQDLEAWTERAASEQKS